MQLTDVFYRWVPGWLRLPVMFLLFFVILSSSGVYLGNATDMYSGLGVYAESYTEAFNALFIGMALGLFVDFRLKQRFTAKSIFMVSFTITAVMSIVCATTDDPSVVVAACLILGFCKISAAAQLFAVWLLVWSKKADTSRLYPFLYALSLAGSYFMSWVTTEMARTYDWRYAYVCIIGLILVCLLAIILLIEHHPLKRIVPLYQVDWIGLVLLGGAMMLLNYVLVYGKVEDWLDSGRIKWAFYGAVTMILGFIKRELSVRHPLIDLRIFRRANFRSGLFYFILIGVFFPSTIQNLFTGSILHYEAVRGAELNLFMIPGVLTGAILSYYWYAGNHDPVIWVFIGFLAFVIYNIIIYMGLGPVYAMEDFWLPSVVKGFGIVVLYISIGLRTTAGFEKEIVSKAVGMMILVRSFLGNGIFSSLYSYLTYSWRIKHLNYMAGMIDSGDNLTRGQGGAIGQGDPGRWFNIIQDQASLAASKEISGYIVIAGIGLLAWMVVSYSYGKVKNRFEFYHLSQ